MLLKLDKPAGVACVDAERRCEGTDGPTASLPPALALCASLAALHSPPSCPTAPCSGEYRNYRHTLERAIHEAYEAGLLGKDACGTGIEFHVYTQPGAGAYVCGEPPSVPGGGGGGGGV